MKRFSKMEKVVGVAGEDPFSRLPDELIISHIFNKVSEAKSLCRCSLVSKKFSSLVYETQSISFKIPLQIPLPDPDLPTGLASFPGKIVHVVSFPLWYVSQLISSYIRWRCPASYATLDFDLLDVLVKFLGKFTAVKSLLVEFDYSATRALNFHKDPVIRWMIDPQSATFISVFAPESVDEDKNVYIVDEDRNVRFEERRLLRIAFGLHLGIAVCTGVLMQKLVPFLPESISRVVIIDSNQQGRLDLGENQIVEMRNQHSGRNSMAKNAEEERFDLFTSLVAATPEQIRRRMELRTLFLDKSKCEGKGTGKKGGNYDGDYLKVKEAFPGEEAVYIEAVMEMLKEIRGSF